MFSEVIIDADPFHGIDAARLAPSPLSFRDASGHRASESEITPERRAFKRFAVEATGLVRAIDASFRPAGPAFRSEILDLSASGVRLVHTASIGARLIAVQLRLPDFGLVTVAVSVLRSIPRGHFFEVAGRIIARLERSEKTSS